MLELQKIFLLVGFFNWISCNKSLKAKISHFFTCFFCLNPRGWNVLEAERLLCSWRHIGHIGWRNTKICIHGASWMEQKCVKCWKSPIFEGKLWVFISYLSEMKIVSMFYNPSLFTFYSLFLSFFVLEIFKFKYDKVFIRHSASISKFEWFEQPWIVMVYHVSNRILKKTLEFTSEVWVFLLFCEF